MSKVVYHSFLDDTFKRPWSSARLFVDNIPSDTSVEELKQFFFLRHDKHAIIDIWINIIFNGSTTFAFIDFNSIENAALFLNMDQSGPIKFKQTSVEYISRGTKYTLIVKPSEPPIGCRGQKFNDRQVVLLHPVGVFTNDNRINNVSSEPACSGSNNYLVKNGFQLINKPIVIVGQFMSANEKWDATAKLSSYNIPLIIKLNHATKNKWNIELGIVLLCLLNRVLN
jgi:RNA recognition motif-containing protein